MFTFLKKSEKKDEILIIGCGRLGAKVATLLSEKNFKVTIIDKKESTFRRLGSSYGGFTIEGDGSEHEMLKKADISKAEYVVVTTDDDNTNILIGLTAKKIYDVENVLIRVYDTSKSSAYEDSGIIPISPSKLAFEMLQVMLSVDKENNK